MKASTVRAVASVVLWWFSSLFGYTLIGMATYRLHEYLYPGESSCSSCSDKMEDDSPLAGLAWPIMLPIQTAIFVSRQLP